MPPFRAHDTLGDEPVVVFDEAVRGLRERLVEPGALDRLVQHRSGAELTGATLLGLRIFDTSVHAWDLARAIGADETLPADAVEFAWPIAQQIAASPNDGKVFAPPTAPIDESIELQTRLLRASGRVP